MLKATTSGLISCTRGLKFPYATPWSSMGLEDSLWTVLVEAWLGNMSDEFVLESIKQLIKGEKILYPWNTWYIWWEWLYVHRQHNLLVWEFKWTPPPPPHTHTHIYDAKIVSSWVRPEDFQYKFVQVPVGLVEKRGILSGGHQCGAGHKVSDDKVKEWSSGK